MFPRNSHPTCPEWPIPPAHEKCYVVDAAEDRNLPQLNWLVDVWAKM